MKRRIRLLLRETNLLWAAIDALYWLKQLKDDPRGLNESEQVAIDGLEKALTVYRRAGVRLPVETEHE